MPDIQAGLAELAAGKGGGVTPEELAEWERTGEVRLTIFPAKKKTVADVFREIGRWEGETGAELDPLFVRQRSNRQVITGARP